MNEKKDTIEALTALASATTPHEAVIALRCCQTVLAESLDAYQPLLDMLAGRAREVQQLRRLAGCDELTGVANRRAFSEALEREVALHNRKNGGLAVILLDLDGLKEINDTHGHAAGDEAIVAMANACERTLRGTDLLARLGGDEFAVLIPSASNGDVEAVAYRLREAIQEEIVAGQALRVSLGVATAGKPPVTAEGLLAIADSDLYQDKRHRKGARASRAA